MGTTANEIKGWLIRGKEEGATHVIVVTDTFDYEDYPSYIMPGQSVHDKIRSYENSNSSRIMEVYNLSMDIDTQLNERRAYNL